MLEQVHNALWIADDENVSFYGAPYPTRSVIVRLENGDLWICSPVELTAGLRAEIDHLGPGSPSREPRRTPRPLSARVEDDLSRCSPVGLRSTRSVSTFLPRTAEGPPAARMAFRYRPSLVPRLGCHGRDCVFPPAVRDRNRHRLDPDVQRSVPTGALVALLGAP